MMEQLRLFAFALLAVSTATMAQQITKCPDNNYPHQVDLGIGVRWACCNVGASAPYEIGGYYAWGETKEKGHYDIDNYWYYSNSKWENIGSYINGTRYDVATRTWGEAWRMPTDDDVKQLISKCTKRFITINGIPGMKFTGPNGRSLFLPAGGRFDGTNIIDRMKIGFYWTACTFDHDNNNESAAYNLDILTSGARLGNSFRSEGNTIRPVSR